MIADGIFDAFTVAGAISVLSGSLAHNIKSATYTAVGQYSVVCAFVPPGANFKRVHVTATAITQGITIGAACNAVEAVTNYATIIINVKDDAGAAADCIFRLVAEGQ